MHKEFTILEDIIVHSVPDGIRTTLEKGKSGIISQSLGDNYTIVVEGNTVSYTHLTLPTNREV